MRLTEIIAERGIRSGAPHHDQRPQGLFLALRAALPPPPSLRPPPLPALPGRADVVAILLPFHFLLGFWPSGGSDVHFVGRQNDGSGRVAALVDALIPSQGIKHGLPVSTSIARSPSQIIQPIVMQIWVRIVLGRHPIWAWSDEGSQNKNPKSALNYITFGSANRHFPIPIVA
jgi:hypothetical protein